MKIKTKISKNIKGDTLVRSYSLSELIENYSFSDVIFILLKGEKPSEKESKIFASILNSTIDHGAGTTSSLASRIVSSAENSINTSVAAGILAMGDLHGGAIEKAMYELNEIEEKDLEKIIEQKIENKEKIYGFGHKIYKIEDPRVKTILRICKNLNFESKYIDMVLKIEELIEKKKRKKIPLNIDGLMAAILLEMSFSPEEGKSVFIIARTPGLVAHSLEEKEQKSLKRLSEDEIVYEED